MAFLIIWVICGIIAAAIAHNKGRNAFGWFFGGLFLGLVGIVIVACLSNLKEQEAYRQYQETERRRLREQLRQEQMKTEAFRQYSMTRLDTHDQVLGIDTRSTPQLASGQATGFLPESGDPPDPNVVPLDQSLAVWYYEHQGDTIGPVTEREIRTLLTSGTVTQTTLVWTEGFANWQPLNSTSLAGPMGGA